MARKATTTEIVKIHHLLGQHLAGLPDGTVEYEDGMSDAGIAQQVAEDLPTSAVARVRVEMFGNLKKAKKETMEERVTRLEDITSTLAKQISELAEMLVNHIKEGQ